MTTICTSNLTSGFVDLATYDETEKYLYGGEDATVYFVRETKKATWFTQVPVCLAKSSGFPDFSQQWSVNITRAGDYLLNSWLRITIPAVTLSASNQFSVDGRLRWTRNLLHNLIQEAAITFNDLVAHRFENYFLDFWAAFTTPAGKLNGYNNMIGNIDELIQPHAPGQTIPEITLNLPLPFFFARDSGTSLPCAAIPYNEMKIQIQFRNWNQLLILDNLGATGSQPRSVIPLVSDLGGTAPSISQCQVWANYALVSNEERKRMGCGARDILIEQVQTAPFQTFNPSQSTRPSYDIRFSHAVKTVFFGVQNITCQSEWSNYTAASPIPGSTIVDFSPSGAVDPIVQTSLVYEATQRLATMGSDYFALIQPWYHAPVIPLNTGFHMYSYALDFFNLDPTGSTNYGKLTNISIIPEASVGAILGAAGDGDAGSGLEWVQKYLFICVAFSYNVIRVNGGAVGFPVL